MDKKVNALIHFLCDGREKAKKQAEIEIEIGVYRDEIRKIILRHSLPIGSDAKGYFLINNQVEFDYCVNGIDKRINGLIMRKKAITIGWEKRKKMRTSNGINYPKEIE